MNLGRIAWVIGAYIAGTSFVFLVAWTKGGRAALAAASRTTSETDAHILIRDNMGAAWMVLAATVDVGKAALYPLAARTLGNLPDSWTALVGFALVVGYAFPLVFRATAGRGLAPRRTVKSTPSTPKRASCCRRWQARTAPACRSRSSTRRCA